MWQVAKTQLHLENAKEKNGIVCMRTPSLSQKRPGLSVRNLAFSSKGRGPVLLAVICLTLGSVGGQCQVERRSKIPPAYPELNATPSLHEACHEQNH